MDWLILFRALPATSFSTCRFLGTQGPDCPASLPGASGEGAALCPHLLQHLLPELPPEDDDDDGQENEDDGHQAANQDSSVAVVGFKHWVCDQEEKDAGCCHLWGGEAHRGLDERRGRPVTVRDATSRSVLGPRCCALRPHTSPGTVAAPSCCRLGSGELCSSSQDSVPSSPRPGATGPSHTSWRQVTNSLTLHPLRRGEAAEGCL